MCWGSTGRAAIVAMAVCGSTPFTYALGDGQPATVAEPDDRADYWGGTSSGFTSYVGQSFKPSLMRPIVAPTQGYYTTFESRGDLCRIGDYEEYEVQMELPHAALLQSLRWWAFDDHPTADLLFRLESLCLPSQGAGTPVLSLIRAQSTLGAIGPQSNEMTTINLPVNMKECTYRIVAIFTGAVNTCSQRIYKVRAQWVRQVSPPPATARFLDVPPNHPFFRFVEALAASGITSGCSGNQYCPDAAVTRGQMAVFLATALGLSWGGL